MDSFPFVFADRATVPCWLGTDVQAEVCKHIVDLNPDKILLITDEVVSSLHGDYLPGLSPDLLASTGEMCTGGDEKLTVEKYILPEGDKCKSWTHLTGLIDWAFEIEATKKSVIVAFGGGALLNISGLFASILYRGTKVVYIPTTLLAMHDVTTSLKTSICHDGRKNNIGSFYAPVKILIDVAFCLTLPRNELLSGIGEIVKNAALLGGKHAEGVIAALSRDQINSAHGSSGEEMCMELDQILKLLHLGIEAKMTILREDAYEKTSGMIFEYGHTVSHALEKAYGDGIVPHGLGVTYGMLSSSYAAEKLGIMTSEDRKEHDNLCWLLVQRWQFPEPKPTIEVVMERAMKDSKRGITSETEGEISDVLLHKVGDIVPSKTQMLSKFPSKFVCEWLETMGFPHADSPKVGEVGGSP